MLTNTVTLSRRIVAALDPDGTRWPQWHVPRCPTCGSAGLRRAGTVCLETCWLCTCGDTHMRSQLTNSVPDLAQPENLHLLLEVARSLGSAYELECCPREEFVPQERTSFKFKHPLWGDRHYGETESLAVLAAVEAALGIEVEA